MMHNESEEEEEEKEDSSGGTPISVQNNLGLPQSLYRKLTNMRPTDKILRV